VAVEQTTMKNSAEMPFLDHLEELRWRIIWSPAALVVGVVVGIVIVFNFDLLTWLQGPILPFLNGTKLKVTHPGDGFSILMQAAFIVGILVALPVILFQVWAFLSPVLHKHEKRVGIPVILGSVALAVPLYLLYELSITLSFLVYRAKERKRLAEEAQEAGTMA
jgi:sec-independent protein translocase protein TatC